MCLVGFILVHMLFYGIIKCLVFIIMKGKCAFFTLILAISLFILLLYIVFAKDSWKGWRDGLHGAKLEDIEGVWTIPIPNYWELKLREGLLDFNKLVEGCGKRTMTFKAEYLSDQIKDKDKLKRVGFPRFNDLTNEEKYSQKAINEYFTRNVIDMDDPSVPQSIKDNVEFVVDMTDPTSHKLSVDVKRNETRVEELKKKRKQVLQEDAANNNKRINKNVLTIAFDNLSRAHFHRKFKRVTKFLNNISESDNSEYEIFEYFRFHSIGMNSFINRNAMYYGTTTTLKSDKNNVYKHFSENGFITGVISDEWWDVEAFWDPKLEKMDPFYTFDHDGNSFNCDFNYDGHIDRYSFGTGPNSHYDRCLYGRTTFDITVDYTISFWEKYNAFKIIWI